MADHVVLNTLSGPLKIQLFMREAPLASNCFIEQCRANAWDAAKFYKAVPTALHLSPGSNSSTLPEERHPRIRFDKRGMVAYSRGTTSEVLFCRGASLGSTPVTGTVFGYVERESLFVLEDIANKPSDGGLLLYPVGIVNSNKQASQPEPGPKRRRIKIQLKEESDDDELPKPATKMVEVTKARNPKQKSIGDNDATAAVNDNVYSNLSSNLSIVSNELKDLLAFEERLKQLGLDPQH